MAALLLLHFSSRLCHSGVCLARTNVPCWAFLNNPVSSPNRTWPWLLWDDVVGRKLSALEEEETAMLDPMRSSLAGVGPGLAALCPGWWGAGGVGRTAVVTSRGGPHSAETLCGPPLIVAIRHRRRRQRMVREFAVPGPQHLDQRLLAWRLVSEGSGREVSLANPSPRL